MSWAAATDAASRDLAWLLVAGGEVPKGDLDAALHARRAVLDLATVVHRGLTVTAPDSAPVTATDAEAEAVRAVWRLLGHQPRPVPARAVTDVLAYSPASPAGGKWHDVARHAVLATHHWQSSDHATWPAARQGWTAVARTAALVEAVSLLDADLARAAGTAGRHDDAEALARARWSGLAGACATVRDLTGREPLAPLGDVAPTPRRALVAVRTLADLPPAATRLAHLLATTASLHPADVQLIAHAQARTSAGAARLLLQRTPHPAPRGHVDVAEALTGHAGALASAGSRPGRAESVHPSDPRPLAQATAIARYLATAGPDATTGPATPGRDAAAVLAYASAAAGATLALERAARGQMSAGQWLVPAGEDSPSTLVWIRPDRFTLDPPLLDALARASHSARVLAAAAPSAPNAAASTATAVAMQGMPGVQALAAALTGRGARPSPATSPAAGCRPSRAPARPRRDGQER